MFKVSICKCSMIFSSETANEFFERYPGSDVVNMKIYGDDLLVVPYGTDKRIFASGPYRTQRIMSIGYARHFIDFEDRSYVARFTKGGLLISSKEEYRDDEEKAVD